MFDTNGYYKFRNNMTAKHMDLATDGAFVEPMADRNSHLAAAHVFSDSSEEYNTPEERSEASHISGSPERKPTEEMLLPVDILGDEDKVQVEYGIVRHWACANFSYLSHEESHSFLTMIVDVCGHRNGIYSVTNKGGPGNPH